MMGPNRLRIETRLAEFGLQPALGFLDQFLVERGDAPDWFVSNHNVLVTPPDVPLPALQPHPGIPSPTRCLVAVGAGTTLPSIILWGEDSLIVLGDHVLLPSGMVACGDGATVFVGDRTASAELSNINARNGGLVYVGSDGLWSVGIRLASDDMHAIRDRVTGKRLNAFGGRTIVRDRVWLGVDVMVLAGAEVGDDCVVGAHSVVTGRLPSNAVCVGVPARVVRQGVVWTRADDP